MSFRLGVNPIVWSNDDLRALGGDTPVEVCLKEAREAGYDGIELGHKLPRDPNALRRLLEAHGLALVSGWYSTALIERSVEAERAEMESHLALLEAMGCSVVIVAETSNAVHGDRARSLVERPEISAGEMKRLGASLTALGDHTAARGLKLVYHHHMGTVVQTEAEVDALMASAGDSVSLLLDTGHLTFAGGDPKRVAERYAARIQHVHLKDVRRAVLERTREGSFLDAVVEGVFTVPGDGDVEFAPVFDVMAKRKYAGWWVVEAEQDPEKAPPRKYAKLGADYVRSAAHHAGLA